MRRKPISLIVLTGLVLLFGVSVAVALSSHAPLSDQALDQALAAVLRDAGFTGRIESTLEQRLGRRLDPRLANIGRLLWFDTLTGLNDDNSCAGCHSPAAGFGDTQAIAIGIDNNGVVGPNRAGPRNMRRSPMVINAAFFPTLMWNSRFRAVSGDPFDNSGGWSFPRARRGDAVLPAPPADGPGLHSARGADRGHRLSLRGRQRRHPGRSAQPAQRRR